MIRKKANILLAAALFLSFYSGAQYHYSALLDTVRATGFYTIPVTPALSSYLKTDLSDLRIVDLDEKKQPVPYIIDIPAERIIIDPVLHDQKIIKKENTKDKTILVIANEGKAELSHLYIDLKSAAAERTASLSGSDDNANWFVVLDSLLLQQSNENSLASHSQRIYFPPGNYKYFRLTIHNGEKEPLNILKVASLVIDSPNKTTEFVISNPSSSFLQTDSGRYSLIKVANEQPWHTGSIKVGIAGAWFYKRQAKLFTDLKSGLQQTWNSDSQSIFTLSSDNFSGYSLTFFNSALFYLLIDNGDNPPLKIASISTGQVKRNIIAQLEKGKSYSLLLDNKDAVAPEYDLQHFRDRIPASTIINIHEITALPHSETIPAEKNPAKGWIWPVIILIVLLLAVLTWKLTKDMKKTSD